MASRKIALLIGIGDYGAGLSSLQCPVNGVEAMRSILHSPEIGGFDEVIPLVNPGVGEMRSRISEVFAQLTKHDLVLFYFTGHGLKDMTGDFYLTTSQTELFANGRPNAGTAVEAHFLKRELSNCLAERKVVILDCCFGAAFADGFLTMNNDSIDIEAQLGGKGWCILTSSTSSRYALEKKGECLSVYTRYLVEGLKTGGAAPDGQDYISAQNLHEYVKAQVEVAAPAMEPAIFNGQQGYNIVIASVQINNEQRYRKQVQSKIRNGAIGPAGQAVLSQWQQRLGLSAEQAKTIEDEILQPYRERQRHLALYTKALEAEKQVSYPLNDIAIQDLKDLQRLLSLRDEDIQSAKENALSTKETASPSKLTPPKLTPPKVVSPKASRHSETESHHSLAGSANSQKSFTQPKVATHWVPSTRVRAISPEPLKLKQAKLETVNVNPRGEIFRKTRFETPYFEENLGHGIALKMARIPEGKFVMGAAKGEKEANKNERPQQEVTLPEFWMGQYVVTQAQWKAVMGPKVIKSQKTSNRIMANNVKRPLQPIDDIFWTDAVAFCQKLSQQTGRDYRLPSNAQWEYACRARTTTPFHFGDTLTPNLANYNGNYTYGHGPKGIYREQTTEVGCFPPNAFGLYDMHGNVWEWCLERWQTFDSGSSSAQNIQRFSGQKKSLRGGSWFYLPTNCRSAYHLTYPFHNRTDDIGFRVVCLSPSTV